MSSTAKASFVKAVLALKNDVDSALHPGKQKRYDDFVEVHKNAMLMQGPTMIMPMPHRGPLFFPWHRVLLLEFEKDLQKIDSNAVIPYWDWDLTGKSNPFTPDFLGGDGDSVQNQRVVDGAFAYANGQFPIRVWDSNASPGDAGLVRQFGDGNNAFLPKAPAVKSALGSAPYTGGTGSWERVCEGSLHNPVHNWVGGNMALMTSPNDPVFFLHHAYIDYLWEQWKAQHPTSDPYQPVSGSKDYDLGATLAFNAKGEPSPWPSAYDVKDTIKTTDLGYAYKPPS